MAKRKEVDPIAAACGGVIRRLRMRHGMSQRALALKIGCNAGHLSKVEHGWNQPSLTLLFDLAEALGERPSAIVDEVERVMLPLDNQRQTE